MKRIISVRGRRWLHAVQALLLLAGLAIGLGNARTAQAVQEAPRNGDQETLRSIQEHRSRV